MFRKVIFCLCLLLSTVATMAQNKTITGMVTDKDSKEALAQVTIQLLRGDSTFVKGTLSGDDGKFTLSAPSAGKYTVKFTSVGYTSVKRNITVGSTGAVAMGAVPMSADAIMLKGATVEGHAAKVVVKADTFQYNASAYRVPEGSTIEELVKRLPGAQVDDDGKITINGKEVKKILIDGKEFMTGDTKTAMKNLPTSIVSKIKAYDQKSDLAKVTGIDDGEEQTVLDFGIKKGMNKGLFANLDGSYGNHGRYSERGMGMFFNSKLRMMFMGSANNVNDMGFPGGGPGGRFGAPRQGLNATKMAGFNINYDDGKKLQMDGSIRWNHSNGDVLAIGSAQNFITTTGSFTNSNNQSYTRSNSWDARLRLEWKPDTMTNIMFRPSFSYSTNDGTTNSLSASFNDDPYKYVDNPLSSDAISVLKQDSIIVNRLLNRGITYTDAKSFSSMLQLNRRLSSNGRNITLRGDVSFNNNGSRSLTANDVTLYQVLTALGTDSVYQTNRYNLMPTKTWTYAGEFTYSEPIARAVYLQLMYKYQYSYSKSDRSTYNFGYMGTAFSSLPLVYRSWDSYLNTLPNDLDSYKDNDLSRYSEYRNYTNNIQLMLRMVRSKYQLNVGVMLQPQKSRYLQDFQGVHVDTVRTVTNFTPTLDFRYKFSNVSMLRINYRGTTSQPSMSDLLDITDDSDPLNITKGNPGLKPSFTNTFRLFYNTYIENHQQALMTFLDYSNTRNSISNRVTYDEKTGGRTSQPENINGNWNASGAFMYNAAIDTAGYFNINTFTTANYNNYVSYLSQGNASSEKNTTRTATISERLGASYRTSWLEFELNGSLSYMHTVNLLQSQNNMDTWQFSYGANLGFTMPWGTSLSTDLHMNSRRGYSDNAMNTNELVWNAQLSQGFLKGKPLTISLQFYDILHNQSNLSRVISQVQRSDTWYNSINSYAMLHITYRFNLFGGKPTGMRGGEGPDGPRPPRHGGPGRFGRGPMGPPPMM